jgi:hypothetical protein
VSSFALRIIDEFGDPALLKNPTILCMITGFDTK